MNGFQCDSGSRFSFYMKLSNELKGQERITLARVEISLPVDSWSEPTAGFSNLHLVQRGPGALEIVTISQFGREIFRSNFLASQRVRSGVANLVREQGFGQEGIPGFAGFGLFWTGGYP